MHIPHESRLTRSSQGNGYDGYTTATLLSHATCQIVWTPLDDKNPRHKKYPRDLPSPFQTFFGFGIVGKLAVKSCVALVARNVVTTGSMMLIKHWRAKGEVEINIVKPIRNAMA